MIARRLGALCHKLDAGDRFQEPETLDIGWLEELSLFAAANAEEIEEARNTDTDGG